MSKCGAAAICRDSRMYTSLVEAITTDFSLSRLERVISGPGTIRELSGDLERRGLTRAILVTGKTLGHSPLLETITDILGKRCVAVFRSARQHVPRSSVNALVSEIERLDPDCLISFGGGSPIDTCKVANYDLLGRRELVHIALPTTLSAGEYTHAAGVTDDQTKIKSGVSDPRLQPRTVISDPMLALDTPAWLWAATGMRALDHAVESLYSVKHHPLSDALGSKAISLLLAHLPASIAGAPGQQGTHRTECLTAAWFSIFGSMNTRFGLSHLLGHQIGPRWGIPHGVTSCITLPHVMRLMAGIAPQRFGPIAEGFGIPFDPEEPSSAALASAEKTAEFIARFDLPHTLKSAGVPHNEIGEITGTVMREVSRSAILDRPISESEVAALLEASYCG